MKKHKRKNGKAQPKIHGVFYAYNDYTKLCEDRKDHVFNNVIQKLKPDKGKYVQWNVKMCTRCKKFFLTPKQVEQFENFSKHYILHKKYLKKNKNVKEEQKKISIIELYLIKNVNNHFCGPTAKIVPKVASTLSKRCTIFYCEKCRRYYGYLKDKNTYAGFSSKIKLIDYDKYIREKEAGEYIRKNMEQFYAKDTSILKSKKTTISLTNDDYYRIINKIKRQNKYDFIIKGSSSFCSFNNHKIVNIKATLDVIDRDGSISQCECDSYYCENCNLFYIYDSTYERIKRKGIPLCRIYDINKFIYNSNYYDLNSESMMHQFGYNVNQNDNLSEFQRHTILKSILDNGILSKNAVLDHLKFLYNRSKNRKNFEQARSRWQDDIEYVSGLKINNVSVKISSMTKINYIKK